MTFRAEQRVIDLLGDVWIVTATNGSPDVCVWNERLGHQVRPRSQLREYRRPTVAFDEDTLAAVMLAGCPS